MKKNIKIIIIAIMIIGLLAIAGGTVLLTLQSEKKEQKEEVSLGEGISTEDFYNWETDLSKKAFEKFNKVYSKDSFDFTKSVEYTVSLEVLRTQHNQDFSEFNTETIKCNLENSVIRITKDDEVDGLYTTLELDCINSEEKKES